LAKTSSPLSFPPPRRVFCTLGLEQVKAFPSPLPFLGMNRLRLFSGERKFFLSLFLFFLKSWPHQTWDPSPSPGPHRGRSSCLSLPFFLFEGPWANRSFFFSPRQTSTFPPLFFFLLSNPFFFSPSLAQEEKTAFSPSLLSFLLFRTPKKDFVAGELVRDSFLLFPLLPQGHRRGGRTSFRSPSLSPFFLGPGDVDEWESSFFFFFPNACPRLIRIRSWVHPFFFSPVCRI